MCDWYAEIADISCMRSSIAALCQQVFACRPMSEERRYYIKLALNEMIGNAFLHAGNGPHTVRVHIHLCRPRDHIELRVLARLSEAGQNEALQRAVAQAGLSGEPLRETGRGLNILLNIAKKIMVDEDGGSVRVLLDTR